MIAQAFWSVFYSSRQPSKIGPTAEINGATLGPDSQVVKAGV
jgi:hypothetical protein